MEVYGLLQFRTPVFLMAACMAEMQHVRPFGIEMESLRNAAFKGRGALLEKRWFF